MLFRSWYLEDQPNLGELFDALVVQVESVQEGLKRLSLLDESLAISSELGMRPLMERVLSRRDILKA